MGANTFLFISSLLPFLQTYAEKNVEMSQVTAVVGETAYLPCDISYQNENDAVILVLWYREDLGTPIYSVDARERDFSIAEKWSDEGVFGSRAFFLVEREPAQLSIDKVKAEENGVYRCRVDFKMAQTRNSKVNLSIIVPPQRMDITDENGDKKEILVGPYSVGDTFMLRCDVYGGSPSPWVKWFREDTEVDSPGSILPDGSMRGVLRVGNLKRDDVLKTVTCRANNFVRVHPIEKTLTIDLNLAPLTVNILSSNQSLSAGRRYDLLCQSSGSRPFASITWWKNGQRINNAKETLSSDGNTTTSTVSFTPVQMDSGSRLSCRAHNPSLPNLPPLEDSWTLNVQYTPETRVRLGTNLDSSNIKEGSDVYFDCIIKAHPQAFKVEWRQNGHELVHNIAKGVIISNQSLVLQAVGRHTGGNYSCVAYNIEGSGESQPFHLNILYAPRCSTNQQRVYGVAKQERAQITCYVDSNPSEVKFRWLFNNTASSVEVGGAHVARAATSSTVSYTPLTEMDYGTLLCWAQNTIGIQKIPCVYHIIAAGYPDPVRNCSLMNFSLSSFVIICSPGFDGGLPQSFLMEVTETTTQEFVANQTNALPKFTVANLRPSRTYFASIYAYNIKGRSEAVVIRATTLRPPEKRHTPQETSSNLFSLPGVISAALGGTGAIFVSGILLLILIRQRNIRVKTRERCASTATNQNKPWSDEVKDDSGSDDRNPDVIPSDGEHMQVEYIGHIHNSTISTILSPMRSSSNAGLSESHMGRLRDYTPMVPLHSRYSQLYQPQSLGLTSSPSNTDGATYTLPRGGCCQPSGNISLHQINTLPHFLPPKHEFVDLHTNSGDTAL